jgi:hypothetical protein
LDADQIVRKRQIQVLRQALKTRSRWGQSSAPIHSAVSAGQVGNAALLLFFGSAEGWRQAADFSDFEWPDLASQWWSYLRPRCASRIAKPGSLHTDLINVQLYIRDFIRLNDATIYPRWYMNLTKLENDHIRVTAKII